MNKKNRDPYPITDIYFLEMNAVDAATVTVGDLTERLSNDFDTGWGWGGSIKEFIDDFKKKDASKYNSISFGNGADGGYSVWVGVDDKNKVRKIFAEASLADYLQHPKGRKNYFSFDFDKTKMNDGFFTNVQKIDEQKSRIKLFDLDTQSGLIAVGDFGGPLRFLLGNSEYDEDGDLKEIIDTNYFKKNGILQNNTPILIARFSYGLITKAEESSFASSVIHKEAEPHQKQINYSYIELFSNLLDESCYPTKYIFENYLIKKEEFDYENYNSKFQLRIKKDIKLSGEDLSKRLPKAIQILKKQTKILFKDNFQEVFEIRKKQFENFIIGIIKDIEPQELELPTFGKKPKEKKLSEKKLEIVSTEGIAELYDGYKLKEDVEFDLSNIIFPVKKGSYPTYLHAYSEKDSDDDDEYAHIKIVVEGIEGCYLNKDENCKLIVNKKFKESKNITNVIKNNLKSIVIDKIDLRNSISLKEIEKLKNIEDLTLSNIQHFKDWSSLSKLKKLKHLHLEMCSIGPDTASSFFKSVYSLPNLEKLSLSDDCYLQKPKDKFNSNIYPKKLKDFEVIYTKDLTSHKPTEYEYERHKGYASEEKVRHIYHGQIININEFPNFEKFKSLEKLRFYNLFDYDQPEGSLFSFEYDFQYEHSKISKFCVDHKVKDIWIYGYNFDKVEELANTRFLELSLKLIGTSNVKINGIKKETFNNVVIENATSLVILDDNCGYNSSKIIDDIQKFTLGDLESHIANSKLPKLNNGSIEFPIKKLGKDNYNPLESFFDEENLFKYSSWANTLYKVNNYNHFIDDEDYDKHIILVKKSFLDKTKKVIFKNIQHLYYYCVRKAVDDESPIFWNKNERFKIPDGIRLNNLETLHLSCGRKTSFKDLEKICGTSLKCLVVDDMLVDDFSMPKMPKLEKMLINYGNVTSNLVTTNNKKITNFRKFENVPSLNQLDLNIEYDCKNGIELGSLKENNNIKSLKIHHLNPKYVNEVVKIKSLSELDISLWDEKNKVTEKTFEFLKDLKNLKKLKLSGGGHGTISIDYKKMMTFINKNIEDLEIDIVYKEDNHKVAYNCLAEINNRFRNLKKLRVTWSSCFIDVYERFNSEVDFAPFKFKEDKEVLEYSNKKTKLKSTHDKYKFQLDFKYLSKLKNLELIDFNKNYSFKTTIINENKLFKLPKLTRIVSDTDLFSKNFFKNIAKSQQDYLNKCKKLQKYKSLNSKYDLEGKEREQYEKLGILCGNGYYGKEASQILKDKLYKK